MSLRVKCLLQAAKQGIIANSLRARPNPITLNARRLHHKSLNNPMLSTNSNLVGIISKRQIQTDGDKEFSEFLDKEIVTESKTKRALPKIKGFEISTNGSDVTFSKKVGDEVILVKLNVNHTVDAEEPEETTASQENAPEAGEMKSKPNFIVEITKNGKTLAIVCDFNTFEDEQPEEEYGDAFEISDLSIYEGEKNDQTYSVSGSIMDGFLYELLMNMLLDRGITTEFADHLVDYCTAYEHGLYIDFLQKLKGFVSK